MGVPNDELREAGLLETETCKEAVLDIIDAMEKDNQFMSALWSYAQFLEARRIHRVWPTPRDQNRKTHQQI